MAPRILSALNPPLKPGSPWYRRVAAALGSLWALRVPLLIVFLVTGVLFSVPAGRWALHSFVYNTVIGVTIALGVTLFYAVVVPYLGHLSVGSRPRWFLFHAAMVSVAAGCSIEVGLRLMALTPWFPPASEARAAAVPQGVISALLVVGALGLVSMLQERTRQVAQRERDAMRAHLEALQSRTNPHFLFNSLNAVAALIEEEPQAAIKAVERLSELLRYTLAGSKQRWVPLADEVAAVRSFLEIESLRFGERLQWSLDWDRTLARAPVPPLCLQPVVENAVVHGIGSRTSGGSVKVAIERGGAGLRLRVEDDGPGPGGSQRRGTGTAMGDLESRLALLYGRAARLSIGAAGDAGCRVTLELPLQPPTGDAPVAASDAEKRGNAVGCC